MKGLNDAQVQTLVAEAKERRESERDSALDYIRGVLSEQGTAAPMLWRSSSRPTMEARAGLRVEADAEVASTSESTRSQWERFTLIDGMELNVRRPLSRIQQRQLDKILSAALNILGPEEEE